VREKHCCLIENILFSLFFLGETVFFSRNQSINRIFFTGLSAQPNGPVYLNLGTDKNAASNSARSSAKAKLSKR
jgi:hypothetical protein